MQQHTSVYMGASDSVKEYGNTFSGLNEVSVVPQSGMLPVSMKNDYLFRALLQQNNNVLKGLICALLHMDEADITSVAIINPIRLGEAIDDKDYIMDIHVIVNGNHIINIEMQVINLHNWTERSLCYLARNFNQLKKGEAYESIKPVIQIGLLDYTLFPECPEFYATYRLLNVKNHMLYSDKLQLSVLNLTRIDLATEEDKQYHIDHWAELFNATTWEELQMLAQDNKCFEEASETVYYLTQEEQIRLQCQAREDYNRIMNGMNNRIAQKEAQLAEKDKQLAEKDDLIASLQAQLAQKQAGDKS